MAKDSPDIWMPLYIGDYLGKTMHLSTVEHGAYLLLLMAYWKNGGPIPAEDRKLAAICRIPLSEFSAIRSALEEYFEEENGLWRNPRADREIIKWAEMKDDKGFGAAVANFKRFGTPIPEKYAERYAERIGQRNAEPPSSVTPSPSPSSLPSPASKPKSNTGVRFAPPSLQEVQDYCTERRNNVNPKAFLAKYEANGWMVGKNKMKDWKATVRYWETTDFNSKPQQTTRINSHIPRLG